MSKEEFEPISMRTGKIALVVVGAILVILVGIGSISDPTMMPDTLSLSDAIQKDMVYTEWEDMQSSCSSYGSPGNFGSTDMQFAWDDCMNKADSWLNNNLP